MNISNWTNKEIVKFLLARKHLTQKSVIEKISKLLPSSISETAFSERAKRNNLRIAELQAICDVLGYNLVLEEKQ